MLSKRVVLVVVALFCLVSLVPAALYSQNISSGTIAGTVTDPSNASVADATATLTDTATNIPRTTTTNEAGRYVFANVPPGTYTLTINKAGFRASKITGQVVNVGSSLTLNVPLEIGATSQVLEVTATNAEFHTLNRTMGNTLSGNALETLASL